MDLIEQTKTDVNTFRTTHAYQGTVNDCFVPWWLARKFGLTAGEAMAQAPGGSHDFGLDGFHLKLSGDMPTLHLIQGKFSSDVRQIRQGVQGFGKILPLLAEIIDGKPTDKAQINSVITRLAAKIQKHRDGLGQLQIHFAVIHLEEQELAVRDKLYGAFEEFREQAKRHLPEHQVSIDAIFPSAALPAVRMTDPVKRHEIRFVGVSGASAEPPVYYLGLAHLADLVKLYESYYDYLFSKNVRSFLMRKANSGPAKYIKASLRQICLEMKRDPQYFLALHNGITLHARSAVQESDRLTIHGPNVLNGCQTVKTAYLFRHDLNLRDRIDDARWNNVRVPLRVVITEDEALIRDVTIGNNRQTELRPSALRANEEIQLEIERLFFCENIYYERQEEAFSNLRQSNPQLVEEQYFNSNSKPIKIEELAQVIACASDMRLEDAARVSRLFEDPYYERVFSDRTIADIRLLVFLRNLFAVTSVVLKDLKQNSSRLKEMSTTQFRYPAFRLLSRYLVRKHREMIDEYGSTVLGQFGAKHEFRVRVRKECAAQNSGLQQLLPELWLDENEKWRRATDPKPLQSALKRLRLTDVNVFEK